MKVAIYTRVSTDSESQLQSLKHQSEFYLEYCKQKGYEIVDIYSDEGLTGTNMKRDGFLRMMHNAGLSVLKDEHSTRFILSDRKAKFEYIITKDVSRFSRNINVLDVVAKLVKKGVYIHFQNANIDTKEDNYEFLLTLFLNFSAQESKDRSTKVKFGLKQRANNGVYHFGSERLYGYDYDAESKEIYLIEEEANLVKRVFDIYTNEDKGSRLIADLLNGDGHTTQNGHIWSATAIVRMLKNEKYTGNVNLLKFTYGNVSLEDRQKQLKDEKEWVYKESLIPSIIDTATYTKAQEIMSSRTTQDRGIKAPVNIFSKKLKCAKCGKNYIRSNQKQGENIYYFYACATRRRTKECDNHSITLNRLEKEMKPYCDGELSEIISGQKVSIVKMLDSHIVAIEIKQKIADSRKKSIRNEINTKEQEIDKIIDSFSESSDLVKKAIERKIENMQNEKTKLEMELLSFDESILDADIKKLNEMKSHIFKAGQQKIFTLEEAMSFVREIVIDDKDVTVKFTFDTLLKQNNKMKDYLKGNLGDIKSIVGDIRKYIVEQ